MGEGIISRLQYEVNENVIPSGSFRQEIIRCYDNGKVIAGLSVRNFFTEKHQALANRHRFLTIETVIAAPFKQGLFSKRFMPELESIFPHPKLCGHKQPRV